jgi:hypothetical protein
VFESKVDPIRYAWERCNRGVSLPAVLARSTGPAPMGSSLSSYRAPAVAIPVSALAAARAAVHSRIVGDGPLASKKVI